MCPNINHFLGLAKKLVDHKGFLLFWLIRMPGIFGFSAEVYFIKSLNN